MFNAAPTVTNAAAPTPGSSSSAHQHRSSLPPLAITSDTTNPNLYRHSNHSSDSEDSQTSPITALDSSAALILVHDDNDDDDQFNFTDDEDEDRGNEDEIVSPLFEVRRLPAFPPLPPVRVFLYLVSPYLKLGALNLPYSHLPLKYGLPALLLCALASAFARQIWYMLARYLRKADMADILCDTFARGRGKEGRRAYIRSAAKAGTALITLLVAVTYLRYSIYTLLPLLPNNHHRKTTYLILTAGIGLVVGWLSYAISLNSKRVVYSTWLSILSYLAWIGCVIYAHGHGLLKEQSGWLGAGSFWQGLATTAFALCSSSTLPLYASLKTTSHPIITTGKTPRARSFRLLSLISVILAVLCLLPSVIFSAFPNAPATSALSSSAQPPKLHKTLIALDYAEVDDVLKAPLPPVLGTSHQLTPSLPEITLPDFQLHIDSLLAGFSAATLLLGIPSVMVTVPPIAIPSFRLAKFNISRVISMLIVLGLSLIPPAIYPNTEKPIGEGQGGEESPVLSLYSYSESSKYVLVLTAATLVATFASTYLLPSFLHIFTHVFKRPVAIVVPPPQTPLLQTHMHSASGSPVAERNGSSSGAGHSHGRSGSANGSPRTIHDELLLRKERALQRRQFRRRIIWDIGVWLLFGTSLFGIAVLICGFAGVW
ncbi:hypothetical protein CVT24_003241 [Panaeolus cyanescens]|uniref:Amino acid transporter transmembrane domain-containing protein n=1 Tax=Panaeolus cyanescens TaxID=181874 RepID=A0A409VUI1_9AGAR|nr:hypothetical protein CVT24_003241 [Panaeolus cyanescens]